MTLVLDHRPALSAEARPLPSSQQEPATPARSLLRFITCGSVDDGKSSLIGRLLFEAGAIPDDQLSSLAADSQRHGTTGGGLDFALLVDGLQAEREQGITIDVAYRYFATEARSFIVADTPGHEQYTRNMATGASTADAAIILIDARKGVLPQTCRHSAIVSLVGVRHVLVAINKIDLIGYDRAAITAIADAYRSAVATLGFHSVTVIPVSARDGDNIKTASRHTPWHQGPTLIEWLESVSPPTALDREGGAVLPVQWVNRPSLDFRGFAGTVAAGRLHPGDAVVALPAGTHARVERLVTFDGDLAVATAGQAVTVTLDREIDISRGDVLIDAAGATHLTVARQARVRLLVTADRRIAVGDRFSVRLGTTSASAQIAAIQSATDMAGLAERPVDALGLNDVGTVDLAFDRPLALTPYAQQRALGALILIDRMTDATAAMGIVMSAPARDAIGRSDRRWWQRWTTSEVTLLRLSGWALSAGLVGAGA
ncbi:MAG: GTP-binding protein, partial [Alphaproteobacteria bacterium]|nr:GTP-binding protein [Alphaproteobacteria bacterium]